MRWLGILTRVVGWLLTPLVAWAASFYGAWLLLSVEGQFTRARTAVYTAFGVSLAAGVAILLLWMQLLRRSPRLRHSLHVDREGLPVIDEAAEEQVLPVAAPGEESPK